MSRKLKDFIACSEFQNFIHAIFNVPLFIIRYTVLVFSSIFEETKFCSGRTAALQNEEKNVQCHLGGEITIMQNCRVSSRQLFLYNRCHNPIMQQSSDTAYQSSR